jgi:hypothetical protein
MSWKEKITNIQFKIITGEGSEFTPLWKAPSRNKNFNASVFEFNNIEGAFVARGKSGSFKFPIELHFTGDDHIEEADRFFQAAKDQRPWRLTHPNYGEVLVQPINLNQSDAAQNDSVITGELYETIEDTYPDSIPAVQALVLENVDEAQTELANDFDIVDPEPSLLSTLLSTVNKVGANYKAAAITATDLATVQQALNDTLNALTNITEGPDVFMNRAAELARTPAKFYASVGDRINIIQESYDDLVQAIDGLLTVQNRQYFEAMGGALVIAKAEAVVLTSDEIAEEQDIEENNIVDYTTRNDVINIADDIQNTLISYIDKLGEYQSEVDATPNSYTPTQNGINKVKESINLASGQLLQIAVETKQERKYTVPQPTGIIILVHRLLGNTLNETIENFVESNNILLDEIIQIPKGRELTYYI